MAKKEIKVKDTEVSKEHTCSCGTCNCEDMHSSDNAPCEINEEESYDLDLDDDEYILDLDSDANINFTDVNQQSLDPTSGMNSEDFKMYKKLGQAIHQNRPKEQEYEDPRAKAKRTLDVITKDLMNQEEESKGCACTFDQMMGNPLSALDELIEKTNVMSFNEGNADYSKHKFQPWDIWEEYNLNPWDADIVKRVLREKPEPGMSPIDSRILDYKKIIHVAIKRIYQLKRQKAN